MTQLFHVRTFVGEIQLTMKELFDARLNVSERHHYVLFFCIFFQCDDNYRVKKVNSYQAR